MVCVSGALSSFPFLCRCPDTSYRADPSSQPLPLPLSHRVRSALTRLTSHHAPDLSLCTRPRTSKHAFSALATPHSPFLPLPAYRALRLSWRLPSPIRAAQPRCAPSRRRSSEFMTCASSLFTIYPTPNILPDACAASRIRNLHLPRPSRRVRRCLAASPTLASSSQSVPGVPTPSSLSLTLCAFAHQNSSCVSLT